jgi:hypothetical protein
MTIEIFQVDVPWVQPFVVERVLESYGLVGINTKCRTIANILTPKL